MDGSEMLMAVGRMLMWYLVPAMLGTLGVVGVLSATPIGDGIKAWLRGRREETELMEAMLHELNQLKLSSMENTERLDALERRISQERPVSFLPPALPDAAPDRLATPH